MPKLIGFVLLSIWLSGCGWNPLGSKEDYLRRGRAFAAQGKLDDAAFQFRKALQKDPKYGEAYLRYGQTLALQNKTTPAINSLSRAAELMAASQEAVSQEARAALGRTAVAALLRDPRHPQILHNIALKATNELLAANPNSFEALRLKGYLAIADSDPKAAIDCFRKALTLNPKLPDVATVLAQTLFFDNQNAEAETVARAAIKTFPEYGPVYDVLYGRLMASNRPDEAAQLLKSKIANNPAEAFFVIQLAGHFYARKQPQQADELLQTFVANTRAYPAAPLAAGDFYRQLGNPAEAIRLYRKGLQSPGNKTKEYLHAIVAVRLSQRDTLQAAQAVETLLKQFPDDVDSLAARADLRMASGNPAEMQKAVLELAALVKKEPARTPLRDSLARAYRQLGRDAEAQTAFQEILQNEPNNRNALRDLADLSIRAQKPDEALRYAERLLEIDPKNTGARLVRTSAWALRGRFTEVRAELRHLTAEYPDRPEPWLQLATLDVETKEYAEAEQIFRRLYQSSQGDIRPLKGLLLVYMTQSQPRKALALTREAAARSSADPQFQILLAATAAQAGDFDLALSTSQKLASDFPNNPDHLIFSGQMYERKGQLDAAILSFQNARSLAPTNPSPLANLARVLAQEGRYDEAITASRQSLKLNPDDPALSNGLAWNLAQTGKNLDEATLLARHALAKDPTNISYLDTAKFITRQSR